MNRTEFAVDYVERQKEDEKEMMTEQIEHSVSHDVLEAIEEYEYLSLGCDSSHACGTSPCEECVRYCSKECVRLMIRSNHGDDWADELNNIDDALEERFRHD